MSVIVQTRIDPKIRAEASLALKNMGLSISDAVRLMLVKIAKEKVFPFEIWRPNSETISAIEEAKANLTEELSIDELRAQLDDIKRLIL